MRLYGLRGNSFHAAGGWDSQILHYEDRKRRRKMFSYSVRGELFDSVLATQLLKLVVICTNIHKQATNGFTTTCFPLWMTVSCGRTVQVTQCEDKGAD